MEVIAVAMSGGVDSSVAALRLREQGYAVIGFTMLLWESQAGVEPPAIARARQVADFLDIPHVVVDLRAPFQKHVIAYLLSEYSAGRTPNPCLACNRQIKFGHLLVEARRLGAQALATGHYARRVYRLGRWRLLRGADSEKDQSYVLHMLGQEELAWVRFPLGELTKREVRAIAEEKRLPVAHQPESQEICFIEEGEDYRSFMQRVSPSEMRPGPIFNTAGQRIGTHRGLPFYTIGQRKGLGISAPEALYVIALDPERNAVIAGTRDELGKRVARAVNVSYVTGENPTSPFRASVKIRYKAVEMPAWVHPLGPTETRVEFDQPLRDITPGQGIVFYIDDEVIGGGTIWASE